MKVRRDLKTLPQTWFFKASERTLAGIPDFIICAAGHFVGVELKRDDKAHASRLQSHTLGEIQNAGGCGWVAHPGNWQELFAELKRLTEE